MSITHSALVIGPQGSGKSHLANTALRHYGSGIVAMARGRDEANSYYPLFDDKDHYDNMGFDDPDFQVVLNSKVASGAAGLVTWLGEIYKKLRAEYDELGEVR